jgi:hypothetical protein
MSDVQNPQLSQPLINSQQDIHEPPIPVSPSPSPAPALAPTQAPAVKPANPAPMQSPLGQSQPAPRALPKLPPVMWSDTQETLKNIEKKLGGPVLSYFTSLSIVGDDVKYFYTHLRDIGFQKKLFFIIASSGGDGKSAYRIAALLKNYCDELVVVIPEIAASAATMLSLAGDSVIMTPLSFLTAVDTSITHPLNPKDRDNNPVRVELEEIRRAVEVLSKSKTENSDNYEIYKTIFSYIHPVAFGSMERTSTLSEMLCQDMLSLRKVTLDPTAASTLINKLNHEYPAHGYPITRQKAKSLGLPIVDSDDELNNMLWRYLNANRVLTEPVRTDFTDSYFHKETYINAIESVGRRLACRNSVERRLDPIIKGWTTLREEYKWEALFEVEKDGQKKLQISTLNF